MYGARKGDRWFVVLDGKAFPQDGHDFVGYFAFSPDSRKFVYAAGKGNQQSVVVDGKAGPKYERLFKPAFTDNGIEYLAESDSVGWLLRCRLSYPKSDGEIEVSEEKVSWLPEPSAGNEKHECKSCQRKISK